MKNNRNLKGFLLVLGLIFCSTLSYAQDYKLAAGLRLGSPLSFSAKYFVSETTAIEGYVGFRTSTYWNWVSVNAAYLKHNELDEVVDGLSWYYGGGASVYFWSYKDLYYNTYANEYRNTSIGFQGYVGMDYKFEDQPINISLDWVPTFFLNSFNSGFGSRYGSLAVRYTLKE